MGKIIAIAGNIGSGKTTLAGKLTDKLDWKVQADDIMVNPYIDDFYDDMYRWSFNMQVYYLKARLGRFIKNKQSKINVIQDRTIYEDVNVFAPVLHAMGLMSDQDYNTYKDLFELIDTLIDSPDLLIYLRSTVPNLLTQIQQRGRSFESAISGDYLQRLNERYEVWIANYNANHIIVDIEEIDFAKDSKQLAKIVQTVKNNLI